MQDRLSSFVIFGRGGSGFGEYFERGYRYWDIHYPIGIQPTHHGESRGLFFRSPISIVKKEVVYKSRVYLTPLKTPVLIDGEAVRDIVAAEFTPPAISRPDVDTGAVIITGESARKENAAEVLEKLSGFAGEFVVSTAGPDRSPSSQEREAVHASIALKTPALQLIWTSAVGLPTSFFLITGTLSAKDAWTSEGDLSG